MNLQGGDFYIKEEYYRNVYPYIKRESTILNIGSGIKFYFERDVKANFPKTFITSVDHIPLDKIPSYIDEYRRLNIEKPMRVDKKYEIVTCFEVAEHLGDIDMMLKNCFRFLEEGGTFIIGFPNLASLYCRLELLFGYQPHILEVSKERANFGMGVFGKRNNPLNMPVHHIRGITKRAMEDMVQYYNFKIIKSIGVSFYHAGFFRLFAPIAPAIILICKKN